MTKPGHRALAGAALGTMIVTSVLASESVSYTIDKTDYSISESLTGQPGDAEKGRAVAIDRKRGNCLACHTLPIPEQPFHGRIAPPLNGVGARYTVGQLRLRVVDPKVVNPNSIMPAFYKSEGFHRVMEEFEGKPILTAAEVEDVVAYLATLK